MGLFSTFVIKIEVELCLPRPISISFLGLPDLEVVAAASVELKMDLQAGFPFLLLCLQASSHRSVYHALPLYRFCCFACEESLAWTADPAFQGSNLQVLAHAVPDVQGLVLEPPLQQNAAQPRVSQQFLHLLIPGNPAGNTHT